MCRDVWPKPSVPGSAFLCFLYVLSIEEAAKRLATQQTHKELAWIGVLIQQAHIQRHLRYVDTRGRGVARRKIYKGFASAHT